MSLKHLFVVFLFSLVALSPLANSGYYTSHDGENHLVRIVHFYNQLRQGVWYPRWIGELNYGRGYPLFDFTYPLPYYFSSVFMGLGFGSVASLKAILAISTIGSGIFYYLWSKDILASGLFMFVPYRFLNLYVRAALGEIVAIFMVTLVLYASDKWWFPLAIAGLILSHPPLALIFVPLLVLYRLIDGAKIIKIILQTGLGIMISAIFWLPAIILTPQTNFLSIHTFAYQHLLDWKQIFYSPWGFGFSKPWGEVDGMSFQLGIVSWLILILATIFMLRLDKVSKLFLAYSIITIILIIYWPGTQWLWQYLGFIQYPWRLLAVPMVFLPMLGKEIVNQKLLVILILVLAIYSNRNHIRINLPQFSNTPDSYFFRSDTTTTSTPDELRPLKYNAQTKPLFTTSWSIYWGNLVSLIGVTLVILVKLDKIKL